MLSKCSYLSDRLVEELPNDHQMFSTKNKEAYQTKISSPTQYFQYGSINSLHDMNTPLEISVKLQINLNYLNWET